MKLFFTAAAALAMCQVAVQAAPHEISLYTTKENVTTHELIDLDVKAMNDAFSSKPYTQAMFDAAFTIYEDGANSPKSSETNGFRKLQKFSHDILGKYNGLLVSGTQYLQEFDLFRVYWGSDRYSDDFVADAASATSTLPADARKQFVMKGTQYQVVWMYILREAYEAVKSCKNGEVKYKNWDEAVAFYTGSRIYDNGTNAGSGTLLYTLAKKRCASFDKCQANVAGKPAEVLNAEAFKVFDEGLVNIVAQDCPKIEENVKQLRKQMQIALIQGMLQYAYKAQKTGATVKDKSEAWAFTAGVIPFLQEASPDAGFAIRNNLDFNATQQANVTDGLASLYSEIYTTFAPMCISCEEVGVNYFIANTANSYGIQDCQTDQAALDTCDYLRPSVPVEDEPNIGLIAGLGALGVVVIGGLAGAMWYLGNQSESAAMSSNSV